MQYFIEVNCQEKKLCKCCGIEKNIYKWLKLRPSNGLPYEFKTMQEAKNIMELCYGNYIYTQDVRIVKE